MGTEYKDVYVNMEDSGNSCGSSVISELSGGSDQIDVFDGDGVLVSDFETDTDNDEPLPISQCSALNIVEDEQKTNVDKIGNCNGNNNKNNCCSAPL
ncbi:Nucleotidyltransferase [Popillia japonica]|uniref:Nucleotidyltransferase n=1 Tax=Popillia japonica TaxID=7064 RepID=A0AAW1LUG3_POPJA